MKGAFSIKTDPKAFDDIQNAIDYYNSQQQGLGKRFYSAVKQTFSTIKKNPGYQIRYDNIRCLQVKKFPYMVHFHVDDQIVSVRAVVNTYLEPEQNWVK
ncbi:MAG: hypothetical protein A2275_09960 [Bacteroidetes bacterium RIFOXYA12_FULL_35_11]|nr:MAG: hypothetical protein A2X01_09885 [Bacteroidetes bacterium GWF2_35_48]OFY83224.1 MAG: hypothetical protein A2275_09960 [Bacteroidetes bacterium RIFOXYA12_FULL_35_11]OFY94460.1 MAG: hypothetical protein A2309_08865 [Bacteroidetes bacterium RIFOXYB2_FULL_35_7]OFY97926.1 MAG: hypothetical protein A2491_18240 [Bacteroidetes bacterium RIFOXYC12_FULL_35_7]HBX51627.1 hypothetical protein [Bacteroidales bacterium]